jgi:hypothetical protein
MEKNDVKKLQKSVDLIAKTTAYILENMATKDDIKELAIKVELKSEIHDLRTDLKGFKEETRERFDKIDEKLEDLSDTDSNFDKRIEKLEVKAGFSFSPAI